MLIDKKSFHKEINIIKLNKRTLSQESNVQDIPKKLADNKLKNILIYSCTSKGSMQTNIIGLVAGTLLLLMGVSNWDLLGSNKFKSSSQSEEEKGLSKRIFSALSDSLARYLLCSIAFITGFFLI